MFSYRQTEDIDHISKRQRFMLEISYQMTSVLEKSIDSQYSGCPAGSRVLPDLEKGNLPAFEINISLLLVSSFFNPSLCG